MEEEEDDEARGRMAGADGGNRRARAPRRAPGARAARDPRAEGDPNARADISPPEVARWPAREGTVTMPMAQWPPSELARRRASLDATRSHAARERNDAARGKDDADRGGSRSKKRGFIGRSAR